jgi:hypothetical protein
MSKTEAGKVAIGKEQEAMGKKQMLTRSLFG